MRTNLIVTALVLLPAAASAQVPCTPNARQVVNAAYLQVLERPANRLVVDPLVEQLTQGQTSVREIVRELAMSPDHRQRFLGANTPAARDAAITVLYRHLLGRTPDEEGLRAHAQAFVNGDPTQIINTLIDSSEYQQAFGDDTVPGGKARYCGAEATSSGLNRQMRFGTLDVNRNGAIELNEWTGSRASFAARDWNADGILSGEEVRTGGRRTPRATDEMEFDPSGAPAAWTAEQFRQIDRNRDNHITSSEWYYGQEFFRRADRNRDSVLTMQEFTGSSPAWDDDRDMRFSDLDINANGRVERGEWQGSQEAFRWLDRNNDNILSRAEVVGEGASTEQFNTFTSLDANSNGTISIAEWRWSRASFVRYDTNQDGVLSRQEFTAGGGTPSSAR